MMTHTPFFFAYAAMCSGGNKNQKLVSCFFEDRTFCKVLITIPLKMYSKIGQPKWILVGQMLKLVRKWPMADLFFMY